MVYYRLLLSAMLLCSTGAFAQQELKFKPFATQFKTSETIIRAAKKGAANTNALQAPENIRLQDMQTAVRMTWDASSGTGVDPQQVTYTVYDLKEGADGTISAVKRDDVAGATQYDITMITDEGDPDLAQYGLTAKYGDDQTDIKISEPLAIGKPYGLPFADSFKNGNTGNFWWADCASNDDYGLLTDAMLTSSDGDNGCFGFMAGTENEECSLVSHKIALGGVENPVVTFSQYINQQGDVPLTLEVVKPDGTVETVDTKSAVNSGVWGWKTKYANLNKYANERYIVLRFRFTSPTAKILTAIDNITIRDEKKNDISVALSAPEKVVNGQTAKLAIKVENKTASNSPAFQLKVKVNGEEYKSFDVKAAALKAYKSNTYKVDYPTSSVMTGNTSVLLTAEAVMDNDDNPADNVDDKTMNMEDTWRHGVENLKVEMDGDVANLSWSAPLPNEKQITDGFEDYAPWSTTFGEWTLVDGDKATNGGMFEYTDYPHYGELFAFIIMNPSDIGETLEAHTGTQFAAAPYPYYVASTETYYPDADNWLISPELSGKEQTVTFWACNMLSKDLNGNWSENDETFYFKGSKTDTGIKSFTDYYSNGITHRFDIYGGYWAEYKVTVSEGTKYFAIHHTTPGMEGLMLMLDDFTFEIGGTPVSYNVYRDGELVSPAKAMEATVTGNPGGTHTYAVTAVYADGSESLPVSISGTTGIAAVNVEKAASDDTVYSIDGMKVGKQGDKLRPGLYIMNKKKVVVR